jgi:hypothetical protein
MNTLQLAHKDPKAFLALPDPYQADSCLTFYRRNGKLYCKPLKDQVHILGRWRAVFNRRMDNWEPVTLPRDL